MCGITGFWVQPRESREVLSAHLSSMNDALLHRGPDDGGIWVDENVGIGLANRRLAILDLSSSGHQPILSSCGRFVIAYNGEVYNFETIRKTLLQSGRQFRSHTDTEVIAEGCAVWGVLETLRQLNGMFAFALWDRKDKALTLVRDRVGIKPLYYGRFGSVLLFGSELKALVAHPAFRKEIDQNSLALFLRHGYIPAPYTIYKNVRKLPPGHYLTLLTEQDSLEPTSYWSAKTLVDDHGISPDEATAELDTLLRDAVRLQMVSDVPLGAFLSGGIDSSTVVALMQAQSTRRIRTFSIGFTEEGYNEANYASKVAEHLGTEHEELYVSPEMVADSVQRMPVMYDEPLADTSQIPTYLLAKLTRRHVTVSLSGDGGDELFGGYDHYRQFCRRWKILRRVPQPLRAFGAGAVRSIVSSPDIFRGAGSYRIWARFRNLAGILEAPSPELLSHHCLSHWRAPASLVSNAQEPSTAFTDEAQWSNTTDPLHRIMYLDLITYLPEDVLAKVDRASMAVSLEARVPILDHRVVEFAMAIPARLKFREGRTKWLLRAVLRRYVSESLFDRPKMGFSLPIGLWLRTMLRPWAEDLLGNELNAQREWMDVNSIRQKWTEHKNGVHDWGQQLWNVLMFEAWRRCWM